MLLAVDIGNTHTVFGLHEGEILRIHWRSETRRERTGDELGTMLRGLFELAGRSFSEVTAGIISSVVPAATGPAQRFFRRFLDQEPLIVGPGLDSGLRILYENPQELGPDRLVNAVAAHARFPGGAIVVDLGTATKLDVVTDRAEYAGGVIAPGLLTTAEALHGATARLPRVELQRPKSAIGRNTVASLQAGLVLGYAGLVDGLVARIRAELTFSPRVIATGGLASLIAAEASSIEEHDELLTLRGLRILHERNRT
jgi:type III pantothenate kinase